MIDTTDNYEKEIEAQYKNPSMGYEHDRYMSARIEACRWFRDTIHKRVVEEKDKKIQEGVAYNVDTLKTLIETEDKLRGYQSKADKQSAEIERLREAMGDLIKSISRMRSLAELEECSEEMFSDCDTMIDDSIEKCTEALKPKTEKE